MSIKISYFLTNLGLLLLSNCVLSDDSDCDPFPFGVGFLDGFLSVVTGELTEANCPCQQPCENITEYIKFYYTTSGSSNYFKLDLNNTPPEVQNSSRKITVVIHGFTDSVKFNNSGWMEPTGVKLANNTNGIAILVDYGDISNCEYFRIADEFVPRIGYHIASVLTQLNVPLNNVELVGHSLGGQITGYAGCALNGKIGQIIALDAAGPGFDGRGLNNTCAQFVQAMHTSRILGKLEPLGHVDFYANNQSLQQPGCIEDVCSHLKAVFLNYASLFHQYEFLGENCEGNSTSTSRFGPFNDGQQTGSFCFNTSECFPYALNRDSTKSESVVSIQSVSTENNTVEIDETTTAMIARMEKNTDKTIETTTVMMAKMNENYDKINETTTAEIARMEKNTDKTIETTTATYPKMENNSESTKVMIFKQNETKTSTISQSEENSKPMKASLIQNTNEFNKNISNDQFTHSFESNDNSIVEQSKPEENKSDSDKQPNISVEINTINVAKSKQTRKQKSKGRICNYKSKRKFDLGRRSKKNCHHSFNVKLKKVRSRTKNLKIVKKYIIQFQD